jgi:hypothetical protein
MVRFRTLLTAFAAVLAGAIVAACGNTTAPPQNRANPASTSVTTSTGGAATFATITAGGVSATSTLPDASGVATVTETIGTSPFGGDVALATDRAAAAERAPAAASPTAIAYLQFVATVSVTFTGSPNISFTVPSIIPGDAYYLAVYQNGAWLAPAAGPAAINGDTVTFSPSAGTITIAPGTPVELALYATTAPTPTPTPTPVPTPVASPNSLVFGASAPTTQPFSVSESGDTANYTAAISCTPTATGTPDAYVAELVSTTATPNGSGTGTFTVQSGNDTGTCTVTVTDARSATATVSVAVDASNLTVSGKQRGH